MVAPVTDCVNGRFWYATLSWEDSRPGIGPHLDSSGIGPGGGLVVGLAGARQG